MTVRFYSSIAQQTTLTGTVSPSTTVLAVASTTGFPSTTPFVLALDYGAATEELVDVTGVAGLSLTVTRAVDGTSATLHNAGALVRHVSSARDFADSRAHENASTAVHGLGVGSALVGTTDVQTLTNKTLTAPTINGTVTGAITFGTEPNFSAGAVSQRPSAINTTYRAAVNGDAFNRFDIHADGTIEWGPGPSNVDVNFARSATGVVGTNGKLTSANGFSFTAASSDQMLFKASSTATGFISTRWRDSSNVSNATVDDQGNFIVNSIAETNPVQWTVYTPTWTASTTNPTLGNGTLNGRWIQIGKTVHFTIELVFGSTTTVGSGNYSFALPAMANANISRTAYGQVLGAAGRVPATVPITNSTNSVTVFVPTSTTNTVIATLTSAGPLGSAWATGNLVRISGTYEA